MKRKFYLGFLMFLVFACTNESLTFKYHSFEQKTTLPCLDQCTYVRMVIPIAMGKSVVGDSINKKLLDVAKDVVYYGDLEQGKKLSYPEIMSSFISSFEDMQERYPEEIIPWEATIDAKLSYQSDELINIEVAYYNYSGGVHGFSGIKSLLFDKVNGRSLAKADLFKDEKAIEKLAETQFRKTYNIPENEPINSTGFFFEEDTFCLPKTFFISDKGLLLYYNTYEIKTTKEDPIECLLPMDVVGTYLNYK
ncbi:MAG: DUF4163 domain-containing protein [Flavobacteriales bacterium]|nr:DUF4163 domain-containing protein [Flavobacteriales bacterium]